MDGSASLFVTTVLSVRDLNAFGNPVPDCTGGYNEDGIFAGQMSYRRIDGAFFIYYRVTGDWYIGSWKGDYGPNTWAEIGTGPAGTYDPFVGVSGIVTVQ